MKALTNFAIYIQNLNKKDFEKYLVLFLIGITILSGIYVYRIYHKSTLLVKQIKNIEKLAQKTAKMVADNKRLQQKEEQLEELLKRYKEFSMKTFFEQFYSQHNLTPEAGWETIALPIEGNDKFDEVVLSATFKNQNTQVLVKVLDTLDKKEMVYIKGLTIKHQPDKKITFELTIATMKYKRAL